ncbi:glycosyltransferase family 4 protein [Spirosoma sp. SC4-14]|uniref:glycosyltransferase family 4 protein n=1 Tax=Spirosoma sp. SC4-14 TaxID=3128900 RepID=UPI0030D3D7EF
MRILYIVDNYYPHIGGAELLFQNLAEGMAKANHKVTVLTPKNFPEYRDQEMYHGVQIVRQRVPPFAQRYFFTIWAIWKAIQLAKQHDLIHTATYNSIPLAWLAGLIARKKTVLTIYEVWDKKWYNLSGQTALKASLFRLFERTLLLFPFNRVICISDSTLRDYKALFPSVPAERIYPGVDYESMERLRLTAPQKNAFRQAKNWKEKDYVILGFGRPGISKGFDYLIEAVPTVVSNLPNARFVFIFPSAPNFISLRELLVQRLESFNLPASLTVLDRQSQADLFAYIQSVDCVVIPSLAEGFGYAAIEACTLAASVVTTTAGSIPEVVSGKVYLTMPANSHALAEGIIKMATSSELGLPSQKFTNEAMIRAHSSLYKDLLNQIDNSHPELPVTQ